MLLPSEEGYYSTLMSLLELSVSIMSYYTYNLVYCIFMLYEFSSDRLGNAVANIYDVDWWSYQVQQHSTSNLSRLKWAVFIRN
mgnify:CR=1 FL=1